MLLVYFFYVTFDLNNRKKSTAYPIHALMTEYIRQLENPLLQFLANQIANQLSRI